MDLETFNISQDDCESDTSQEDLDEYNATIDDNVERKQKLLENQSTLSTLQQSFLKWKRSNNYCNESMRNTGINVDQPKYDMNIGFGLSFDEISNNSSTVEDEEDNNDGSLQFMLLDSDFSIISTTKIDPCVSSILPQNLRSMHEQSYNRLYGVTESGQSVLVNVYGFVPYFYALPSHKFTEEAIPAFEQELNAQITSHVKNRLKLVVPYHDIASQAPPILSIELLNISDCNIYDFYVPSSYNYINKDAKSAETSGSTSDASYQSVPSPNTTSTPVILNDEKSESVLESNGTCGDTPKTGGDNERDSKTKTIANVRTKRKSGKKLKPAQTKILKIHCRMPKFVWAAMQILKKDLISVPMLRGKPCLYQTFESSINHNIRFLTDLNLAGCSWLKIENGNYFSRPRDSKLSHCQIEVDCYFKNVTPISNDLEISTKIPPLRILSFDIEVMVRPPSFTFPRKGAQPVLQIGGILATAGSNRMEKFIFMLGSCDELQDTNVFNFTSELEMLEAWRLFVVNIDPDIMVGYNIKRFDLPYLLDRATVLKSTKFPYLGRIKESETTTRDIQNPNKKPDQYDEKSVNIAGRIIFDMLVLVKRHDTKPGGSFKLMDVASRYLASRETKADVSYRDICKLQNTSPATRKVLANYCVQDSRLPYLVMLEHNPNPDKNRKQNTLDYYIDKARVSGTPLRYLVTKSPQYNTYYKIIRKHKNPAVKFVPNTPSKKRCLKRRYSAPSSSTSGKTGGTQTTTLVFPSASDTESTTPVLPSLPNSTSKRNIRKKSFNGRRFWSYRRYYYRRWW